MLRAVVVLLGLSTGLALAEPLTLDAFRSLPDNRIAVRTSFGVRWARVVGATEVELAIGMSVTEAAKDPAAYRVVSFDDAAYGPTRFVEPTEAKVRAEVEAEGTEGCPFERFERTLVTLTLPFSPQAGATYHVVAQGVGGTMVTGAHTAATFVNDGRRLLAPDTQAVDLAVLGLRRMEPVGPRLVMLEFGPAFSPPAGSRAANYHVAIDGEPVAVSRLGRVSRVDTYLPVGWPFAAIPMHEVYLELERGFGEGAAVQVTVDPAVTQAAREASIVFDSRATLSNSIKVNQVGYLADSPVKVAYLGRWMGSFPEGAAAADAPSPALLLDAEPPFTICREADGEPAFEGQSRLVHRSGEMNEGVYKHDHSGENVYLLDFTDFRTPGRYFISVPGVGRSLPFFIGDDVYAEAFRVQAYGVFAQRCGIELREPYSEWYRLACHARGITPTTQQRLVEHETEALAGLVGTDRAVLPARGGHHDAGDYNPRSHLDVAQALMDAYEISPRKFADGQLSIPEAGNGLPDILDEAWWALQLWTGLQDDDGGIFNGTESNGDPNFIQTVELDTLGDYAYAKDAAGSLNFAGAMSQASRIWRGLGRDAEAADMLDRARRAYDWALAHAPEGDNPQAFASPLAYASAELLRTTREARFNEDFLRAAVWAKEPGAEFEQYQVYDQSRAAWAYANCDPADVSLDVQAAARAAILRTSGWYA